jgi:hypothetical protein
MKYVVFNPLILGSVTEFSESQSDDIPPSGVNAL